MADKFEALEQQLEMFIENTRQMGIIVATARKLPLSLTTLCQMQNIWQ